jgi:hypothetical protein
MNLRGLREMTGLLLLQQRHNSASGINPVMFFVVVVPVILFVDE